MSRPAQDDHDAIVPGCLEYFPLLFSDRKHRENIHTILRIDAKWRKTVVNTREPSVARIKLAWWEKELERIRTAKGNHPISPKNQALSTEVTDALALLLDRYALLLENHIEIESMTLEPEQYGPLTQWAICVEQQNSAGDEVREFSHELGMAWELCQRILARPRMSPDEIRIIIPTALRHLQHRILPQALWSSQRFSVILASLLEKWFKKLAKKEYAGKNPLLLIHQLTHCWQTALKCR